MNSIKKIGFEVHFVGKGNIKQIKSHTTQGLNKNSLGHRVFTIRREDLPATSTEPPFVHILARFQVSTLDLIKRVLV